MITEFDDIIGKSYGELTVLNYDHEEIRYSSDAKKRRHLYYYKCKCSCGKEVIVARCYLTSGSIKSCGHTRSNTRKDEDIIGKRFGRLVAKEYVYSRNGASMYKCICDCGNETIVARGALLEKKTRSCGCYAKEVKHKGTHNMTKTRFYRIWQHIKDRCLNKNNSEFHNYGGSNIKVCDRWMKFENFYIDMYDDYIKACELYTEKNTSIDRINPDKGYYKNNCRWTNMKTQGNNRKNNIYFNIDDEETLTLMQMVEKYGIPGTSFGLVRDRIIRYGWNPYLALVTPVDLKYSHPYSNKNKNSPRRMVYFDPPKNITLITNKFQ